MKLKIRESNEDFEVVKRFQVSYVEGEDPYDDSAEIYDNGGGFEIVKDLETGLYGWQSDAMDESSDITFNSFDDAYNDAVEAHDSDNGILMIDGEIVDDFENDFSKDSDDENHLDSADKHYHDDDISPKGVLLYDGERETTYVRNKITKVIVEPGVDKIPACAFSDCIHLKFVQIPKTVTNIGFCAFYNCIGMKSITIPDSVKYIEADAFQNCKGLTSITIPNSVTSLKDWTFAGCKNLTSITIPDSVKYIGRKTFYDCTGLTSITIPDSVISIDSYAFENCTGLKYITIPDSVTYLGAGALEGIDSITVYTDSKYVKDYCLKQEENITVKPLP